MEQSSEQNLYESLIAAHVTRHSVCFTHELAEGAVAAGSGVLVRCGGNFGVVTCAHVLWGIVREASREPKRRVGISVPAAADTRVQAIGLQLMEFAQLPTVMKRNDKGDDGWSQDGPDIGFVQLPLSTGATLASVGSVLDLDAQAALAGSSWSPSARELMHLLVGVTESHVGLPVQMLGRAIVPIVTAVIPLVLEPLEPVNGFDRLRMKPEGRHSYPPSYEGMSGGGVWAVTFGQRDGLPVVLDCRLTGVAYYQTDSIGAGGRQIIGHGPKSIYERLLPEIRALNS